MSASPDAAAPTGGKNPAQRKERRAVALGHASKNTSSVGKRGGLGKAHQLLGEELPALLEEPSVTFAT